MANIAALAGLIILMHLKCASPRKAEGATGKYVSEEMRLLSVIFHRYKDFKKLARPVLNASSTMNLHFGVAIIQMLDFDEKNQLLTTLVWKKYRWKDELLTWDPQNYGGVDVIRLPAEKIWTPDVILYNNVGSPDVERHKDLMVVSSDGSVVWVPPVKYQSSCVVDMTEFPFDVQTCELRFGSWSYDIKRLNPMFIEEREEVILDDYVPNSEWEIVENKGKKNVIKYPCCEYPYADLTFQLTLKRKVTFHLRLILIPTVLLSAMSVSIFWIPPTRPDRTTLGLSLFSSFFLLLILIVNSSPATEDAKLGQYYIVIILMVSFGIILSVTTINICQCTKKLPKFMEKLFIEWLACLLCAAPESRPKKKKRRDLEDGVAAGATGNHTLTPAKESHRRRHLTLAEKWKTVAVVLDRIFFLIFLFALTISFITIFPQPLKLFML